jgi:hypothetical protein
MPDNAVMSARRVFRGCLASLILPTVVVVPVCGYRWHVDSEGRKLRDAAVARIEVTDPRWRWEDIEADRPPVPDAENSVRLVEQFNRWADNRHFDPADPDTGRPVVTADSPNRLLRAGHLARVEQALERSEPAGRLIEPLSRRPRGRVDLVPSDDWTRRRVPRDQDPFRLVDYLTCESERLAHVTKPTGQAQLIRALINLSHVEGQGRFNLGYSFRLTESTDAARRLERAIATRTFDGQLADFQQEFQVRADVDSYRPAARQIRADYDWAFRGFETGEVSLGEQLHVHTGVRPSLREVGRIWHYRPNRNADWAAALDVATRAGELADLPESQWLFAWASVPGPPLDDLHPFSSGCYWKIDELLRHTLVTRALLRCTAAALAVEQHRVLTGDWPTGLDGIPKAILSEVPADPFTGKPLRFGWRADGVTVYSVGLDGADDGGVPTDDRAWLRRTRGAGDIVFRLYNPADRRLQPIANGVAPAEKK